MTHFFGFSHLLFASADISEVFGPYTSIAPHAAKTQAALGGPIEMATTWRQNGRGTLGKTIRTYSG